MLGLAAQANTTFTATSTGTILISLSGLYDGTANAVILYTLYYGTGSPPAQGAAATGTGVVTNETNVPALTPGGGSTITIEGLAQLTVGTPYWIDLAVTNSAGTYTLTAPTMVVVEVGNAGQQGATGPMGPTGLTGAAGAAGAQGAQGAQGPQGVQGAQGVQGVQGPRGVAGPGAVFYAAASGTQTTMTIDAIASWRSFKCLDYGARHEREHVLYPSL